MTGVGGMTDPVLDPVIHPVLRLRLCAMLAEAEEVDFGVVQQHLAVSASNLSKQVKHLADQGYVVQRRDELDKRRAWLALTPVGRERYRAHVAALRRLV